MMCNDDPSVYVDKSVTYRKGLRAIIVFILKFKGGNIVTCTQKPRNYVANINVLVTPVTRTVSQEPICLSRRNMRRSKSLMVSTISSSLTSLILS